MIAPVDTLWFQTLLLLTAGGALAYLLFLLVRTVHNARRSPRTDLLQQVNALLPQTQCGRCGFAGCRPYARAIVNGTAINKCPPGGQATIQALARLLGVPVLELDPGHGEYLPPMVAVIREAECIGCTKCIQACPEDAILGAAKQMHTVIAEECTGCDLCVSPCPVDCIDMVASTRDMRPQWPLPRTAYANTAAPHGAVL